MSIPNSLDQLQTQSYVESTAVPGKPGVVVLNPDGSNISGGGGGGGTVNQGTGGVSPWLVSLDQTGNNNAVDVLSVIPGIGATNLGKQEGATHANSDVGVMALGVSNNSMSDFTVGDLNYTPIAVDDKGSVRATGNNDDQNTESDLKVLRVGGTARDLPTIYLSETRSTLTMDLAGNVKTAEQLVSPYEDNANGVLAVAQRPLASIDYQWAISKSTALEASRLAKAAPGSISSLVGRLDSTAATGTYYIQTINAAAVPADGAVTLLVAPLKINHVNGTDDYFSIDFGVNGKFCTSGIVIVLSTTEFTKTIGGAFLSLTIDYK